MKAGTASFLLFVGLLVGACSRRENRELPPDLADQATRIGREVSGAFMVTLKGRLLEAIDEGGPAFAIGVCQDEAGPITTAVARRAGILDLRRTSLDWRNPQNRPTGLDEVAWAHFQEVARDRRPAVEDWVTLDPGKGERVVYFRALRTIQLCTTCHGTVDQVPSEVRVALAEHYPEDRAVGFAEGDLRGLLRIDLDRKTLEEIL